MCICGVCVYVGCVYVYMGCVVCVYGGLYVLCVCMCGVYLDVGCMCMSLCMHMWAVYVCRCGVCMCMYVCVS